MNNRIIFNGETVHPETDTNIILHGDSTVKDILDNFSAVPMSAFGEQLANAASLAEVARLIHQNYSFAKDMIDNVEWKIVGSPSVDNTHAKTGTALHTSNGNYIYRTLKFGADTVVFDFDLFCTDAGKILFQIYDNTATPSPITTVVYRNWYRLLINSDGCLQFKYLWQQHNNVAGSGWMWQPVTTKLTKNFSFTVDSVKHIALCFDKSDNSIGVQVDGGNWSWSAENTVPISNKTWYVYLGNTAEAWFDNFTLTNNDVVVSQLDFE